VRWRLYLGLTVVAALSIAAVVVAIGSVTGADDLQRIKSALRLQTNCADVAIRRPSRAVTVKRWAGLTVQSADVVCAATGPRLVYAKFADRDTLARAVATTQPSGGYCRLEDAILFGRPVDAASTTLGDMCQSLGGMLVTASAE
jgi:hypothetical protein